MDKRFKLNGGLTKKQEMQNSLNDWIKENSCNRMSYFTVVQHDDVIDAQIYLKIQLIYGACSGDEILKLVYQNITDTLI